MPQILHGQNDNMAYAIAYQQDTSNTADWKIIIGLSLD